MTEYMTFQEARAKAKDGDLLRLVLKKESGPEITTSIFVGEKGKFHLSFQQYDSDQWQIIPAEPKVLKDVMEYLKSVNASDKIGHSELGRLECTFKAGHKNGRLERDLELRPVVDDFKEIETTLANMDSLIKPESFEIYKLVQSALRKLKPLN